MRENRFPRLNSIQQRKTVIKHDKPGKKVTFSKSGR